AHGIKLGRAQPLSHGQFVDYIVANKISDKSILYSHLEQRASDKIEPVREFFFRHFKDIPTLLATVWDIQASTDNLKRLKMSPWELVCAAARDKCVCDGLWIPLMRDNLRVQCGNFPPQMSQEEKPEEARLIAAITRTLQVGAKKFNNLFFYGTRNAGKSCAIDPVTYIFGAKLTYTRPAGKCNFPLQGIVSKKVAVLQDLRPQSMRIGWDSLLVLLEGQRVAVAMPRNVNSEDVTWSAKGMPFFISGSDKLRISTEDAHREGVDVETQNAMMAASATVSGARHAAAASAAGCKVCRRHLSLPRRAAARSSRHKHSSPSRSSSGGSDSQGEARASGDSSSLRREEMTPLPAAPDEQAIVEDLRRSLQLEQEEAEAEADAQLDDCRDLEAEYASGSPSV
ncbi:unnamed protein product, partial [Effrenium voratum]